MKVPGSTRAPSEVLRAVVTLVGDSEIIDCVIDLQDSGPETVWTFFGLTESRAIFVKASANERLWKDASDPVPDHRLESWTRPLSSVSSISVDRIQTAHPQGDGIWSWDAVYVVTFEGVNDALSIPLGGEVPSELSEYEALVAKLVRALDGQ